jgi:hypothetical protein
MLLKLPNYKAILAPYFPEQKTAIIFNNNLFSLIDSKLLGTENKDSFSTLRFPLEIRLLPKNDIGIDTLRLIVLHLKANTGTDSSKMLAYNSRKRSADWLKMYLNKLPQNNYTMVLGDWNDDIDLSIFNNLPSPFIRLLDNGFNYRYLSKKLTDNGQGTTNWHQRHWLQNTKPTLFLFGISKNILAITQVLAATIIRCIQYSIRIGKTSIRTEAQGWFPYIQIPLLKP